MASDSAGDRAGAVALVPLSDVPEGDARGFDVQREEGWSLRLIVVRRDPEVFVYQNRCPHRGTPLDWAPDRFLDAERRHLVCATHGALFRMEDGVCVAGPCLGDGLRPLPAEVRGGVVWVTPPKGPPPGSNRAP